MCNVFGIHTGIYIEVLVLSGTYRYASHAVVTVSLPLDILTGNSSGYRTNGEHLKQKILRHRALYS